MLEDIWPSDEEINSVISQVITPEMFKERYEDVLEEPRWESIPSKKNPHNMNGINLQHMYVYLPSSMESR